MTTTVPLAFSASETWGFQARLTGPDGNPLPLQGARVEWEVSSRIGPVITLTSDDPEITIEDQTTDTGVVTILAPMPHTGIVPYEFYHHALTVTLANGEVSRQMVGTVSIAP